MVHHIALFKLKPEIPPQKLEELMFQTRMNLLKIGEVLSVKCGKNIDRSSGWDFFFAIDFESMDKMALFQENAIYLKYLAGVINPNVSDRTTLNYEMEPGKDIKYS